MKPCFKVERLSVWPVALAVACLATVTGPVSAADDVKRMEIRGVAGLQFDPVRFAVEPGQRVELTFSNPDVMQHNLLILAPGARETVADLAIALGADGPRRHFVPDTDLVLYNTEVLPPGESQTISFTAPDEEGIYPYVCTFPGHASIMYGAMYVTTDPLPPLAEDPHVPAIARTAARDADGIGPAHRGDRDIAAAPEVRRTFVPDASPAAIAVHLGGGLSYVWDAATCHLRYAWTGGFVDSQRHWDGAGRDFSEIEGTIFYRAKDSFPIRIGNVDRVPERHFLGYTLIEGLPVFRYSIDGHKVREHITRLEGETAFVQRIEIEDPPDTVFFVVDPSRGALFESSAGVWTDGVLELTADEARAFEITLRARPGHEPVRYWSMDEDPWGEFMEPHAGPGVVGQAVRFSGHQKRSGLRGAEVQPGMSFAGWSRVEDVDRSDQVLFGAAGDDGRFVLGYDYDDVEGYSLVYSGANGAVRTVELAIDEGLQPELWNHFMLSLAGDRLEIYVNGDLVERAPRPRFPREAELTVGALNGERHFDGWLDEVRIWNRGLSADEVRTLFAREAAEGGIER